MKTYVTFGQCHRHVINGVVFDKDCVAVIEGGSPGENREKAFEIFGRQFCFEYPEACWDKSNIKYFPRGYIKIPDSY